MVRTVKKPEERYQEIVSAAGELFEEKGYEKTTMRDVMNRLNIAKGTIYHYFDSKEVLLRAVVETTIDDYIAEMQKILDSAQGNGLDRLRILITSGTVAEEHIETLEGLHHSGNVGMHTQQLAVLVSKLAPLYASAIQQGCEEGIFHTPYPLETAEFLLAGIQFLTDIGVHTWTPETLTRRAQAFPALVEAQLQAPKGAFDFLLEGK